MWPVPSSFPDLRAALSVAAMLLLCGAPAWGLDPIASARLGMLRDIEDTVALTRDSIGRDALDERVLRVLGETPRHEFVPAALAVHAYENRPLSIGHGQTISQPYIVALMTDLLAPDADATVLEIGTGSGYQAAVLAGLVRRVYSMEIIEPLAEQARERLERLGYENATVRIGDGYNGWQEHAPYDAIIVTAAASHIPPPLVAQLKPGGIMVIPVGASFMVQQLVLVKKDDQGRVTTKQILPVRFVPLTGDH